MSKSAGMSHRVGIADLFKRIVTQGFGNWGLLKNRKNDLPGAGNGGLWHGSGKRMLGTKDVNMKHEERNIIHFSFRLMESVEVELKGNIERSDGVYLIRDIRPAHKEAGSLLPPVKLKKVKGAWVHSDSLKTSNLSAAIGKALDEREGDSTNG